MSFFFVIFCLYTRYISDFNNFFFFFFLYWWIYYLSNYIFIKIYKYYLFYTLILKGVRPELDSSLHLTQPHRDEHTNLHILFPLPLCDWHEVNCNSMFPLPSLKVHLVSDCVRGCIYCLPLPKHRVYCW